MLRQDLLQGNDRLYLLFVPPKGDVQAKETVFSSEIVARKYFPIFMKYITGGYVGEEEAGSRLFQVLHDPKCTKSGVRLGRSCLRDKLGGGRNPFRMLYSSDRVQLMLIKTIVKVPWRPQEVKNT